MKHLQVNAKCQWLGNVWNSNIFVENISNLSPAVVDFMGLKRGIEKTAIAVALVWTFLAPDVAFQICELQANRDHKNACYFSHRTENLPKKSPSNRNRDSSTKIAFDLLYNVTKFSTNVFGKGQITSPHKWNSRTP